MTLLPQRLEQLRLQVCATAPGSLLLLVVLYCVDILHFTYRGMHLNFHFFSIMNNSKIDVLRISSLHTPESSILIKCECAFQSCAAHCLLCCTWQPLPVSPPFILSTIFIECLQNAEYCFNASLVLIHLVLQEFLKKHDFHNSY